MADTVIYKYYRLYSLPDNARHMIPERIFLEGRPKDFSKLSGRFTRCDMEPYTRESVGDEQVYSVGEILLKDSDEPCTSTELTETFTFHASYNYEHTIVCNGRSYTSRKYKPLCFQATIREFIELPTRSMLGSAEPMFDTRMIYDEMIPLEAICALTGKEHTAEWTGKLPYGYTAAADESSSDAGSTADSTDAPPPRRRGAAGPRAVTMLERRAEEAEKGAPPKLVTFRDVTAMLSDVYNYEDYIQSTTLDIVAVYLRGQKTLYTAAKSHCEQLLYYLMLPAILLSTSSSVLSLAVQNESYGAILISCLTALNSFLLTLVSYLKLDAKAEAHKTSAYSFEKLQAMCEFNSGRMLFTNQNNNVALLNVIETTIQDIKEKNQFLLPDSVCRRFPMMYSTNLFAEVKRIQNHEILLINRLKTVMNEVLSLRAEGVQIKEDTSSMYEAPNDSVRLARAQEESRSMLDAIIKYRNEYINLDKKYRDEITWNLQRSWLICRRPKIIYS